MPKFERYEILVDTETGEPEAMLVEVVDERTKIEKVKEFFKMRLFE